MPRTHKPRARIDAIRHLREAKGWSQQVLAEKAIVSIKTLSSLEQGNPAQLSTFAKIAKVLDVEPATFMEGHDPVSHLASDTIRAFGKRVEVQVKWSIPFEEFDESDGLVSLIQMLTSLIKAKHEISVVDVSPGSVNVTLEMSQEDLDSLLLAFAYNRLRETQIVSVEVLNDEYTTPENLPRFLNPQVVANWRYRQNQKLIDELKNATQQDIADTKSSDAADK